MTWILAMGLVAAADSVEPGSTLEQAYQKEYAYLRAEKSALEARIAEIDTDSAARVRRAESELDTAQARLVARTRAADRAEDSFDLLQRQTASMDDADSLLGNTLSQAIETLSLDASLAADADPTAERSVLLPRVFEAAAARMEAGGAVGWSEGVFFLPTGDQVSGRIYRFGEIGAWGLSGAPEPAAGALAPAGEGRLQLRRGFGEATARGLEAGAPGVGTASSAPSMLDLFLYEPERAAEEAEKEGGLAQTLEEAGTMGQVLFALGCVSALLASVRALTLLLARRGGLRVVNAVVGAVQRGDLLGARKLVAARAHPTARVLGAVLDGADRSPEERDRIVDEATLRETPAIDRFAAALVVITAGSPLMGLLGTVTGMIATFDVITEHGTGNPKLMSAGIAEALICTALGLAVAIPTLLVGNVLSSVADGLKRTLDRGALMLLNALDARAAPASGSIPAPERAP